MGTKFIRYPFLAILAAPLSLTFSLSPSLFSFTFPPFAMADSQALPHPAPKLTRREIKRPARYRVDFLDEEETKKELQDAQHAKRSKKKDAPYDDAGENGGVGEVFIVEKVLNVRKATPLSQVEALVRWKGAWRAKDKETWEPLINLTQKVCFLPLSSLSLSLSFASGAMLPLTSDA